MSEVATYIDVDQFEYGQSVNECGYFAVALNVRATQIGKPYNGTAEDVDRFADYYYGKFDGANNPQNPYGMTLAQLYAMIVESGWHYQNLYPDGGVPMQNIKDMILFWLRLGYPVLIAVLESSVLDRGIGRCPYAWDTYGLSHIITATGIDPNGVDILVRDTANIGRPGPRSYAMTELDIISATVFVPEWRSRPINAWTPAPPKLPPGPNPTQEEIDAIKNLLAQVLADLAKIKS